MLAQLLNRDFLLESAERLRTGIEREATLQNLGEPDSVARAAQTTAGVNELKEAGEILQTVIARESQTQGAPEDDTAFFPRDAVMSLVQSALLDYYETHKSELIVHAGEARAGREEEIAVTDRELKDLPPTGDAARGLLNKFSQTDIGWASSLVAKGVRAFRKRREFNPQPAPPVTISNRASVALVGDWGTGLPRARKVGAAIRAKLQEAEAQNRDCHLIHLGDVYYSGWQREYEKHFLPHWPVKPGEEDKTTSWSLNANHDMYSGGHAYYDFLLRDPRFARQAQSSFFSIENDHWLILGLDTGYEEHDLAGGQGVWLGQRLTAAPGKKGVLLSHHQMFSAYERGGEKLEQKLQPALDADRIRAWFWGHEHRCAIYEPQRKVQYGRCIGHGGVPVYASSGSLPAGVSYEYQGALEKGFESWALFGFAMLDFDDGRIHARYINENGEEHFSETLE